MTGRHLRETEGVTSGVSSTGLLSCAADGSVTKGTYKGEGWRVGDPLPKVTLPFTEDFEVLKLGPWVSSSEKGGDGTNWTATPPTGWMQAKGTGHGLINGGTAVREFDGWTLVDPVSWNKTAGQGRNKFTKGKGVIAVGDSDEYDDLSRTKFNAALSTPPINISGAKAGTLGLTYDSSWRKYSADR